jgi:uncharacterized protein involved in exopolysaccharide biosynthesis
MGNPVEREVSLREPLNILFKRKNVIIAFFLVVVLTVGVGSFLVTPTYEAKAQVLVKIGRDNILVSSMGERYPFVNLEQEQIINSEVEILKSKALSETVIQTLGGPIAVFPSLKTADSKNSFKRLLKSLWPFSGKQESPAELENKRLYTALEMFQKALTIEGIKKSNAIFIYFSHKDPKMAAIVANKLAEAYIDYHLSLPKSEKSYEFFKNQTNMLNKQLSETEKKLEGLKNAYKISNFDEQKSLQIRQKSDLQAALNRALSEEVETRNRISMLKQQLGATPQNIPQRSEIDSNLQLMSTLQARLVELELREKDLRSKYTDDSRLVKSVEEEIRVVRKKISEQQGLQFSRNTSGTNPTFQHLQQELMRQESEYRAIQGKTDAIQNQLKVCESELLAMDQVEFSFKELERKAELERKNYALYVAKLEESRISGAMSSEKISNVTLVEAAYAPLVPKNPKPTINILLSMVIGLFGGLGLAFLTERINGKIDNPEQIERILKVPVLTSIPEIHNPS